MLLLRPLGRLALLVVSVAILAACSTLPDSAYYHYQPGAAGGPPATLGVRATFGWDSLYTLGMVPPTGVEILSIDGLPARDRGEVELSPGRHRIGAFARFDYMSKHADFEATFRPGVEYSLRAKHHFGRGPQYEFYIEEAETRRRVAEKLVYAQ